MADSNSSPNLGMPVSEHDREAERSGDFGGTAGGWLQEVQGSSVVAGLSLSASLSGVSVPFLTLGIYYSIPHLYALNLAFLAK